ncbi:MAG TPA: hypothetical protein VE862_09170 [Candidatus Acidoferrum sp.]|nr:hypothetical protein [Candidatus Acidoferrum sp.]
MRPKLQERYRVLLLRLKKANRISILSNGKSTDMIVGKALK